MVGWGFQPNPRWGLLLSDTENPTRVSGADDWFREDAGRDERYDYLYSPDELSGWLKKIERIRTMAEEVYVITNNHYRGQAVVNAFELQEGLGQPCDKIPECLAAEYPRLKREPG